MDCLVAIILAERKIFFSFARSSIYRRSTAISDEAAVTGDE